MPQTILTDMQDESLFENKIQTDIFILVGTEDTVVPNKWVLEFAKAQEANLIFLNDDHSFSKNMYNLPNIIIKIIDKKH